MASPLSEAPGCKSNEQRRSPPSQPGRESPTQAQRRQPLDAILNFPFFAYLKLNKYIHKPLTQKVFFLFVFFWFNQLKNIHISIAIKKFTF